MANPLDDSPPGAPNYPSGPLSIQKPPSVGSVISSGQSPDSFFAAGNPGGPGGLPVLQQQQSGIGKIAQNLLSRAATGLSSLFGGTPATVAPVSSALAVPSAGTTVAGRTNALESGLNALELRSTGFKTSPNITVAGASATDAANAAFASRQGPTPAEYNALPAAQRQALDNFKNLPTAEQEQQPNFYQTMIAGQK